MSPFKEKSYQKRSDRIDNAKRHLLNPNILRERITMCMALSISFLCASFVWELNFH
ncbi:MAG: hypothetical protein SFU99_07350 [Saprospiraceae bacterium]|nr:hypothetical protein [Saprospiraceae bacterium]